MPSFGGPSRSSVPNRSDLERELTGLVAQVHDLEGQLANLTPAAKANKESEIGRLKPRIFELRKLLSR